MFTYNNILVGEMLSKSYAARHRLIDIVQIIDRGSDASITVQQLNFLNTISNLFCFT